MASPSHLSTIILVLVLVLVTASAWEEEEKKTFIVQVQHDAKPSIFPTHRHWYESSLGEATSIIHTYQTVFHGFSATLSAAEVANLDSLSHVIALIPEQVRQLHTTRSPHFLGLNTADRAGLLKETDFGSDLVIGLIDTGISPESQSFNDRDLGLPPPNWKGQCVAGKGFPPTSCNRKLIGARYFCGGYEASNGKMNETLEYRSPVDSDGHGTHTASIAAGRYVFPASTMGYAKGMAAGMAPKARLAVYKVCWKGGCYDSDILAAFDAAVADGVDVVSLSVGGVVVPYHLDIIAVGAFGASEAGVFVSASAGNGGPGGLTVTNVAPWMTSVGAGSIDRDFPADVILGNGKVIDGVSVYDGPGLSPGRLYQLVYAGSDGYSSSLCLEDSLDPKSVRGKIVVCDRGVISRPAKGQVVKNAGGVAMILTNGPFDGEGLVADCHVLPATSVGAAGGDQIRKYISLASQLRSPPTATILFKGTRLGVKPAPKVASFSARGPNPVSPEILKPDVIAPGLNILAAWPTTIPPSSLPSDHRTTDFNILSGTSMACPHVSGLAALLKAAHPDWSPAAIRSALITTAYTLDNGGGTLLDESTGNVSSVFDYGAGHVHPENALNPGLVFALTQALLEHKERRKKDNNAVMTMVIKRSKPNPAIHQSRLGTDELFMAIDPNTKQLVYYEDRADQSRGTLHLDKSLLVDNPSLSLHHDKQDCYIDICSPEVLSLFTDNFDYQHLRRHFVKGLLVDDIMGYKIFVHEIHSDYAARIDNFRSYDTVSKDIIHRWTYPLVPDVMNFGHTATKLERQGMYRALEISQSQSAVIGPFTVIGSGTKIGNNTKISNSVIGEGCKIGSNVIIEGCYIWDNISIEDGCKLQHAIVCDGVIIKSGAVLEPGVILSFKVVVGPEFVVPPYSKVSLFQQPIEEDSDEELEYADSTSVIGSQVDKSDVEISSKVLETNFSPASQLGIGGAGHVWSTCEGGHEEEWRHSVAPIPKDKILEAIKTMEDDMEFAQDDSFLPPSGELKPNSNDSDDDDHEDSRDDSYYFEKEVEATFLRAVHENIQESHLMLEINSLKLSYNKQTSDCAGALFYAMMKYALDIPHSSADSLLQNVQVVFTKWKKALTSYLNDKDEQIEVILKFEEMCLESANEFAPLFTTILHHLYNDDVIEENAILSWEDEKKDADEADKVFVKQAQKFIQWLKEAPEEDDEEEE